MGKKMTTQVAIVTAKADNMPVLAGVDTRVMEDMITVVIHEELAQIDSRVKAIQASLEVLKKGGKPDLRMANIIQGYYDYTSIPGMANVLLNVTNGGNDGYFYACYLVVTASGGARIGTVSTDKTYRRNPEEFTNERHYLPKMAGSRAWQHYVGTISKSDASFVEKYMNEMAVARAGQISSCEKEIEAMYTARNVLREKKNNVGVIAARIRIEDSSVSEKDMTTVKKFLGI